jgi:hypothetical protein
MRVCAGASRCRERDSRLRHSANAELTASGVSDHSERVLEPVTQRMISRIDDGLPINRIESPRRAKVIRFESLELRETYTKALRPASRAGGNGRSPA